MCIVSSRAGMLSRVYIYLSYVQGTSYEYTFSYSSKKAVGVSRKKWKLSLTKSSFILSMLLPLLHSSPALTSPLRKARNLPLTRSFYSFFSLMLLQSTTLDSSKKACFPFLYLRYIPFSCKYHLFSLLLERKYDFPLFIFLFQNVKGLLRHVLPWQ